jgi:hypothetical protein
MAIRVNGELVPSRAVVTELVRLVKFYKEHLPEEELDENRDILIRKAKDQAIGAKLLLDEARKAGMRVTEDEAQARRNLLVKEAGGEAEFEELMDSQGVDEIGLQQSIVDSLMVDKFVRALVSRIPEPTYDEVQAFLLALREKGRTSTEANVKDLLVHEKRGRILSECVALLRKKAVIEDDDDLDGADIDALFDSYLDDDSEMVDEPGEG